MVYESRGVSYCSVWQGNYGPQSLVLPPWGHHWQPQCPAALELVQPPLVWTSGMSTHSGPLSLSLPLFVFLAFFFFFFFLPNAERFTSLGHQIDKFAVSTEKKSGFVPFHSHLINRFLQLGRGKNEEITFNTVVIKLLYSYSTGWRDNSSLATVRPTSTPLVLSPPFCYSSSLSE